MDIFLDIFFKIVYNRGLGADIFAGFAVKYILIV